MKKAKLVIFRHGETDYNAKHLMTGQADAALNATGREQAREAGTRIAHIEFDKVYASTLSRAFHTAAIAIKEAGKYHEIEIREEIVEIHTGDFTGRNYKTDAEILAWVREYDKPLPGGESDKMAVERVKKFFDVEVMPRLEKGENVLVVCHAGIVRAFDIVLGVEDVPQGGFVATRRKVPNATPTVYEYTGGKMTHFYTLDTPPAANDSKSITPRPGKTG